MVSSNIAQPGANMKTSFLIDGSAPKVSTAEEHIQQNYARNSFSDKAFKACIESTVQQKDHSISHKSLNDTINNKVQSSECFLKGLPISARDNNSKSYLENRQRQNVSSSSTFSKVSSNPKECFPRFSGSMNPNSQQSRKVLLPNPCKNDLPTPFMEMNMDLQTKKDLIANQNGFFFFFFKLYEDKHSNNATLGHTTLG